MSVITSGMLRSHQRHGTPFAADAAGRLADQQDELLDAMAVFCVRVEKGDIRSRQTYQQFKALLAQHDRHPPTYKEVK